jgi:hypothetical protein
MILVLWAVYTVVYEPSDFPFLHCRMFASGVKNEMRRITKKKRHKAAENEKKP